MCSYYLGPTYNTPSNVNTIQQSSPRTHKNSTDTSFDQILRTENTKASPKNNPAGSKVKAAQSAQAPKTLNTEASLRASKNYLAPKQSDEINGTNLALKELSTELAEQMVGILFNYAMNPDGTIEGGFAETIYSQEANAEKVKGAAKDLIEDLSNQFYEESLREYEASKDNETVKIRDSNN